VRRLQSLPDLKENGLKENGLSEDDLSETGLGETDSYIGGTRER
jgi:hypothetical protein